jgi:hypothetical protein
VISPLTLILKMLVQLSIVLLRVKHASSITMSSFLL